MTDENMNKRLTELLNGLRSIHKLITREKDTATLIKRACDLLVQCHGFDTGTIILIEGGKTALFADAGSGPLLSKIREVLTKGDLPECVKEVLNDRECIQRTHGGDFPGKEIEVVKLESGGKTLGVMLVSAPEGFRANPEERAYFREVADDIAFALDGIEKDLKRARAIETLRYTRDYLDAIMTASPAAIYTLDENGIVTHWNSAAERIFGWTAAEAVGHTLPTVPPEAEDEFRHILNKIISGDTMSGLDLVRRRKSGDLVDISVSTAPLRDANGAHIGAVVIATDSTARRRMEQEIQERIKELKCLYQMTDIYTRGMPLDDTFRIFVNHIPSAYRRPWEVGARISIDKGVFQTANYRESNCCQRSIVRVRGVEKGVVEVCRTRDEGTGPDEYFEPEKQDLLDTIAGRLGLFIDLRSDKERKP